MRTNGILKYCIPSMSFNDDGEPSWGDTSWSDGMPCLIKPITNNSKGRYEDGKYSQASYEVLVESACLPNDINRIKLQRDGQELGEFAVQGIPTPTSMHRTILIV